MKIQLPELPRLCGYCFERENSPNIKRPCTDSANGKHRMVKQEYWKATVIASFFEVHSPQKALRIFYEQVPDFFVDAQKMTDQEIARFRK